MPYGHRTFFNYGSQFELIMDTLGSEFNQQRFISPDNACLKLKVPLILIIIIIIIVFTIFIVFVSLIFVIQ